MEKLFTDVLILGSGAAGIRAAAEACKAGAQVFLVTQGNITERGSTFSKNSNGWGIQALVGAERTHKNLAEFYSDIIRVGLGRCDPKLVRILVEESGPRTDDLRSYGLGFKTGVNGEYIRAKGCFSDVKRAFLTKDIGNIRKTFLSILQRLPVKIVTGSATDLIVEGGTCRGARIAQKSGELLRINAKATILATGGGSAIFKDHLGNGGATGDGYALAYLAGAALINMEFIQFALGLKKNGIRKFLPIAQLDYPHKIVNTGGCEVLKNDRLHEAHWGRAFKERQKHMPFSCRDSSGLIDIAIAKALRSGTTVYWQDGSLENDRFEVVHFAHAFNGGVKINEKAESSVPGLYAAGEVASGPHGADRIGGCMMTATQVFGKRAGQFAAQRAFGSGAGAPRVKGSPETARRNCYQSNVDAIHFISTIADRVRAAMGRHAMVLRCEKGLKQCKSILDDCGSQLNTLHCAEIANAVPYTKVRNMIITANLVVDSALASAQSLGSHYRHDFPKSHM